MWPFSSKKSGTPGVPLTEEVRQKLNAVFVPEHREAAERLLVERCAGSLPLWHGDHPQDFDRIRFAVIKISKGSLGILETAIQEAHVDWRDILMAAGFAHDTTAHLRWNPKQSP